MSKPLTKAVIVESVNNQLGLPKNERAEMVETSWKLSNQHLHLVRM